MIIHDVLFFFSDGSTTKFGQTNPKIGTYIDHIDKKNENQLYKKTFERLENKRLQTSRIPLIIFIVEQTKS
jgi:hypothetical protein